MLEPEQTGRGYGKLPAAKREAEVHRLQLPVVLLVCFAGCSSSEDGTSGGGGATAGGAATGSAATGGAAAGGTGGADTATGGTGGADTGGAAMGGSDPSTGGSSFTVNCPDDESTGDGIRTFHTSGWTPVEDDLWIAPDGDDTADGTESAPLRTLNRALIRSSSGRTIWVKAGTYPLSETMSLDGRAGIRISGVTCGEMPVIDVSSVGFSVRAIKMGGSNYHLRYLEIKGTHSADNCFNVDGSGNTFEWLKIHDCGNTGIRIDGGGADNKVINCDSYLNYDEEHGGTQADGFAAKSNIGTGNEFMGCRAFQNADDGWDHHNAGIATVTLTYCWAFDMSHPRSTEGGDGHGFELGGVGDYGPNGPHTLKECFSFHNPSWGFDLNGNDSGVTCTGCGAWGNGEGAFDPGMIVSESVTHSASAAAAASAERDSNGNLPDIASL